MVLINGSGNFRWQGFSIDFFLSLQVGGYAEIEIDLRGLFELFG
jgi:hypothetical protein